MKSENWRDDYGGESFMKLCYAGTFVVVRKELMLDPKLAVAYAERVIRIAESMNTSPAENSG